ncbi:MAG: type IV pilus secretin PilQ [Gammaproteobacteria bacterium]|nr:type IV pilus secretin PilQ [Gammaproteobacteria bacterium]
MDRVTMKSRHLFAAVRRKCRFATAGLLVLLLPALQAVAAPVSMTDIGFNALPGGKFEIRMQFDGTPPSPQAYTIDKPARIALDLAGVSSKLAQKKHTLSFDNAQSVVVVESGGRTRVIVNLVQVAPYETSVEGNELVVSVGTGEVPDYLKAGSEGITGTDSRTAMQSDRGGISDFNFRRGESGEGQVELQLSDPKVDVDVRLEGNTIKVAFFDTTVPAELQRSYDVVDFATPVQSVDVSQSGSQASIGIKVSGEYDYLAYQADNRYVVSVKPLTKQEAEAKKKEFEFVGEKLSLNFQDIEVRAVLQLIADFTDLNLVASDTVAGRITLRLQNVPWDQALDLILKTKGLDKRRIGNVLMVAPAAEIAERERQEIETNKQLEELSPLQTEFIKIKYADAQELFKLFGNRSNQNVATGASQQTGTGGQDALNREASILSPRGKVIVDERTNSLMVTETADKLEELRRLIKLVDIPVRQVLIEARIVIASTDFSRELGIQWGGVYTNDDFNGGALGVGGSRNTLDEIPPVGGATFPDALAVDLGVSGPGTSSIAIGFTSDDLILQAELSALESSGHGEIVSQPKIITGDKQKATISQGTEIPYQTSSASGETTVEFKDAVLRLDVTPHITPDGRVMMALLINQDSVGEFINGEFGSQIPTIDTTQLDTEVLVGNGQTVVLGGVFKNEEIISESKTPFLGDVPYIGRLFRKDVTKTTKTETLIFITPRILSDRLLD